MRQEYYVVFILFMLETIVAQSNYIGKLFYNKLWRSAHVGIKNDQIWKTNHFWI